MSKPRVISDLWRPCKVTDLDIACGVARAECFNRGCLREQRGEGQCKASVGCEREAAVRAAGEKTDNRE